MKKLDYNLKKIEQIIALAIIHVHGDMDIDTKKVLRKKNRKMDFGHYMKIAASQ